MKASLRHDYHTALIADIIPTPRYTVTNRRGHRMAEWAVATHYCYADETVASHTTMAAASLRHRVSKLPGIISASAAGASAFVFRNVRRIIPAWSPKKYDWRRELKTSWTALVPTRQVLSTIGTLLILLVATSLAAWKFPSQPANEPAPHSPRRPILARPSADSQADAFSLTETAATVRPQDTAAAPAWTASKYYQKSSVPVTTSTVVQTPSTTVTAPTVQAPSNTETTPPATDTPPADPTSSAPSDPAASPDTSSLLDQTTSSLIPDALPPLGN